jgi:hypothetical protein
LREKAHLLVQRPRDGALDRQAPFSFSQAVEQCTLLIHLPDPFFCHARPSLNFRRFGNLSVKLRWIQSSLDHAGGD